MLAGRKIRPKREGLDVAELVNRFLNAKREEVERGELSPRTFGGYHATCLRVAAEWKGRLVEDIDLDDLAAFRKSLAAGRGPVTLANEIRHTRILLRYAHKNRLIDRPVELGEAFDPPSKLILRKNKAARGLKLFEADEVRQILATAGSPTAGDDPARHQLRVRTNRLCGAAAGGGRPRRRVARLPAAPRPSVTAWKPWSTSCSTCNPQRSWSRPIESGR